MTQVTELCAGRAYGRDMGVRERLDSLSRGELAGLIAVIVVTLAGVALWYARSIPSQVAVEAPPPIGVTGASGAGVSAPPSDVPLIVDVAGWVRRPGVYEFVLGDRVIDAVERAGGPRLNANLAALNLAAPLVDGVQILVPKEGAAGATGVVPGASGGLININSASASELEELSGIGEVLAATIVDYRTENGPFSSVDELEDVSGIGPATMEEIRDQITI